MDSLVNDLIKPYLSENTQQKVTALFGGGFKPPTAGHLKVIKNAIEKYPEIDNIIIYVGKGKRDGITQDQSFKIWKKHYKKLIDKPTKILKVEKPIGSIYSYAKNHPEDIIYYLLGEREGKKEDQQDIINRTKSTGDYPNIKVRIMKTPDGDMSGTNAREAIINNDKESFKSFIPEKVDEDEIWDILTSNNLNENIGFDDFDYPKHLKSLTKFMLDVGLEINPLPSVKFVNDDIDNANNFFGKTAYYDPNSHRITLYTLNRHPKDVMRSFAHEMIHHHQNCQNRLGNITTTNTTEDSHLEDLEKEAYQKGNICFRNWTDTITENIIKEGKYDKLTNQISSKIFNYWKNNLDLTLDPDEEQIVNYKFPVNSKSLNFDVETYLLLNPGVDKFEIIDTTGAGTDKKGDFINVHFRTDPDRLPEEWEFISMMIKDVIRHEIEHLTHNIGAKSNIKSKSLEDDSLIRKAIKAKLLPQAEYFKLAKEIDAMLQGMYFRAKKTRTPFPKILNDYLDLQDITPKEKQEILQLWSKRAKELNLPSVLQENLDPSQITVYLDMDGVIADFDQRFKSLSRMSPSDFKAEYGEQEFWDFIDEEHKVAFWVGIPIMDGAQQLVDYVSKYNYEVLTAPSAKKQSFLGKSLWVKKHKDLFGGKPRINFKKASEKHLIKPDLQKTDILIDDRQSTIDNWNNAGGTGILYKSSSQVINDMEKLGL